MNNNEKDDNEYFQYRKDETFQRGDFSSQQSALLETYDLNDIDELEPQILKKNYSEKFLFDPESTQWVYPDSYVEEYPSIKSVLRNRVQFTLQMKSTQKELSESSEITSNKEKIEKLKSNFKPIIQAQKDQQKNYQSSENLDILACAMIVFNHLNKKRNRQSIQEKRNIPLTGENDEENDQSKLEKDKEIKNDRVFYCMNDYRDVNNTKLTNKIVNYSEPIFTCLFTFEAFVKIMAMGLFIGKGAYLSDAWNWLDFIVVITSILNVIPSMKNVSALRAFRLFRPLKSLNTLPSMKILVSTLLASMPQLGGILGLACFFFTIFAILGNSLWGGATHFRCRQTNIPVNGDWPVIQNDTRLCSQYRPCDTGQYCGSLYETEGYKLNKSVNLNRDDKISELNFGISNFDNMGTAFLTIFQCITMEGWTDIIYIFQDAYYAWFVAVYFCLCIIICAFFLLNLTIAVMLKKYEELDRDDQQQKHKVELRQMGEDIGLPKELTEFIIKHDNIGLTSGHYRTRSIQQLRTKLWVSFCYSGKIKNPPQTKFYSYKIAQICHNIVQQPVFHTIILIFTTVNTLCLCFDQYPEKVPISFFNTINYTATLIFAIEVIIKLIGLEFKYFIKDPYNILDTAVSIGAILDLCINGKDSNSSLTVMRSFRLFRLFGLFRVGDLRILLDSIAFTISTIGNYVILLCIFIYVYALIGMSLYAGLLKFDEKGQHDLINGITPRANFDQIHWACLTIFQVLIGDQWNFVMYDCMRATGWYSSFYFISLVILGNIIMMNLFLAILLGNFDKAKEYRIKKKIFDTFKKTMHSDMTLNQMIDTLLGDIAYHTKTSVLNWEPPDFIEGNKPMNRIKGDILKDELKEEGFDILETEEIKSEMIEEVKVKHHTFSRSSSKLSASRRVKKDTRLRKVNSIRKQATLRKQSVINDDVNDSVLQSTRSRGGRVMIKTKFVREKPQNYIHNISLSPIKGTSEYNSRGKSGFSNGPSGNKVSNLELNKSVRSETNKRISDIAEFRMSCKSKGPKEIMKIPWNQRLEKTKMNSKMQDTLNWKLKNMKTNEFNSAGNESMVGTMAKYKRVQTDLSKAFDYIVLILIIASCIIQVIDTPLNDPDGMKSQIIQIIDTAITMLFVIEALIKVIAMGFFNNNSNGLTPYIFNLWNILDFVVVTASLSDVLYVYGFQNNKSQLKQLKVLRALRALRPLRMINRNEGMKLVVNALFASVPSMTNVLVVSGLFILIFSAMGIDFFKGKFYSCHGYNFINKVDILNTFDCLNYGGDWTNSVQNFDNIFQAMLTLFVMMNTEGWLTVLYQGIDAVGIGLEPRQNYNIWWLIYFVTFMIVGSQFIINLFVGVVIHNFNKIKEKEELGNIPATPHQKQWIEIQKLVLIKKLKVKIKPPKGFRLGFFQIVSSRKFEIFITVCIFLNTVVMAVKYYGMNSNFDRVLEIMNYVFAFVFNLECVFKLLAYGKIYFCNLWNLFDFFVVLGTDIGIIISQINPGSNFSSAATVIRGFRIMRFFKLIRSSTQIRIVIDTLINILPQITNVMSLMFLIIFIYAALGMNLFSLVVFQKYYNAKNNFQNFGNSILLLLRCATGENWHNIMHELARPSINGYIDCQDKQTYDNFEIYGPLMCGNDFSYFYFPSYMIIISMLIMNLSVAAVIEGLESARKENLGVIKGYDIDELIELWCDYDPQASGWIKKQNLVFLLYELLPPLGRPKEEETSVQNEDDQQKIQNTQEKYIINYEKKIVIKKIDGLKMFQGLNIKFSKEKRDFVHFRDVFKELIKRSLRDMKIKDFKLSEHVKLKLKRQWEKKFTGCIFEKSKFTIDQEEALLIITKWLRRKSIIRKKSSREKASNCAKRRNVQRSGISMNTQPEQSSLMVTNNVPEQKILFYDQVDNSYFEPIYDKALPKSSIEAPTIKIQRKQSKDGKTWFNGGGDDLLKEIQSEISYDLYLQQNEESSQHSPQTNNFMIMPPLIEIPAKSHQVSSEKRTELKPQPLLPKYSYKRTNTKTIKPHKYNLGQIKQGKSIEEYDNNTLRQDEVDNQIEELQFQQSSTSLVQDLVGGDPYGMHSQTNGTFSRRDIEHEKKTVPKIKIAYLHNGKTKEISESSSGRQGTGPFGDDFQLGTDRYQKSSVQEQSDENDESSSEDLENKINQRNKNRFKQVKDKRVIYSEEQSDEEKQL